MLLFKIFFLIVGSFGFLIIWGIIGCVYILMNDDKFINETTILERVIKTIMCGPAYLLYVLIVYRNKQIHEKNMCRQENKRNKRKK